MSSKVENIWYSAAELADLSKTVPGLPGTAVGCRDRAVRENWPNKQVKGKGGKGGLKTLFQPPHEIAKKISELQSDDVKPSVNEAFENYKSNEKSEINEWLITLCYQAYKDKYKEFESQHTTYQLRFVTSLYNCLIAANAIWDLDEESFKALTTEDIGNLLDILIKLNKVLPFKMPADYSGINRKHSVKF